MQDVQIYITQLGIRIFDNPENGVVSPMLVILIGPYLSEIRINERNFFGRRQILMKDQESSANEYNSDNTSTNM